METRQSEKFIKAKKRVNRIKGFYKHLTVYLVVNIMLLFIKAYFLGFFESNGMTDENLMKWLEWNIIATPLLWGIGLIIHGICVFLVKPGFLKKWEERKIQEYMKDDQSSHNKFE